VTEREQLTGYIVCSHTSFDADQAGRHIREPGPDSTATQLLTQNNSALVVQADQMQRVLPVSMPMVLATTASIFWDMAASSSCF
jgi:hypothetical protein